MSAVEQLFAETLCCGICAPAAAWPIVLDLPLAPSVNDFIRKLGNKSPVVRKWVAQADMHYVMARDDLQALALPGTFEFELTVSRAHCRRGDLDNRIKPTLDWLQRVQLIRNDRFCEKITAVWGDAPLGCRVKLRAWS